MNISNPKTTIGGLPLATTWYVSTRFKETSAYIDTTAEGLSSYIDDVASGVTDKAVDREESLSTLTIEHDKNIIEAFCRYFTGKAPAGIPADFVAQYITTKDKAYQPQLHGYAYLGPDGKIVDDLMPDISLMDIKVVAAETIFDYLSSINALDDTQDIVKTMNSIDANNYMEVANVVKMVLDKYVTSRMAAPQGNENDLEVFSKGDILVVTYDDTDKKFSTKVANAKPVLMPVFSQSYIAGGWICSKETRPADNNAVNASVTFAKLSFNQGEVITVNGQTPNAAGNVAVNLADVLLAVKDANGNVIDDVAFGFDLANDIQQVRSTKTVSNVLDSVNENTGLVEALNVGNRFVFNDSIREGGYAYATLNEYADLNVAAKNITDEIAKNLANEVTRASVAETTITDVLAAEVARSTAYDEYLSGVVGIQADLNNATVTEALNALKQHTETVAATAEANFTKIAEGLNDEQYDVLDVYTAVITGGCSISNLTLPDDVTVTCSAYTKNHDLGQDFIDLYDQNIYNYFGLKPSFDNADISEITFRGFEGTILDIYVLDEATGKYVKIDADIKYEYEDRANFEKQLVASFTILGEYNADANVSTTMVDTIIVRYTKKHTYKPEAFELNQLFK